MDAVPVQRSAAPARGGVDRASEDVAADGVVNMIGIKRHVWRQRGDGEAHRANTALEVIAAVTGVQDQRPAGIVADDKLAGLFAEGAKAAQALAGDVKGDALGFGIESAGCLTFGIGRYSVARFVGLPVTQEIGPRRPKHLDEDSTRVAVCYRQIVILWERISHFTSTNS